MKSLVRLHLSVLQDVGSLCDTNTVRDEQTLTSRWEDEGDSFLTITLPHFAKALERGLAEGSWPKSTITAFKHYRGLPAFMRGFLLRVFSDEGALLDVPDPTAIWAMRQVCYLSHKLERDTSSERRQLAIQGYIDTDRDLGEWFENHSSDMDWESFQSISSKVYGDMFDTLERDVANFLLIPAHGPGAVAEKLSHKARWDFPYWPSRLDEVFPRWRYAFNTRYHLSHALEGEETETPVRVITVPKTQAKPRIIAIEPSAMQYAQQGLWRRIQELVENSVLSNLIGFADQTRNQRMAREGSSDGFLATLDLSEASDRTHTLVVERLLYRWPHLRDFVFACRSQKALVEGEEISLHKYASMGSSLTFPLEAIVFSTIALMGMKESGYSTTPANFGKSVSVYGDDIIVPVNAVAAVVRNLESFGFKVNNHKSFWTGQFRESCGRDFFNGQDVSVVRMREDLPRSRQDAALIRRATEFRNRLYRNGLWRSVKLMDRYLDPVVNLHPRNILESSAIPSQTLSKDTVLTTRWRAVWNPQLHRWQERHLLVKEEKRPYTVDGEGGLLKWFQEAERRFTPETPFEGQERPRTFHIYTRGIEVLPKTSMGLLARGMALN